MTEPILLALVSVGGALVGAIAPTISAMAAFRRASIAARNSEHAAQQSEQTNEQSRQNAARLLEVANRTDGNLSRLLEAKDEAAQAKVQSAYQQGIRAANSNRRRITDPPCE